MNRIATAKGGAEPLATPSAGLRDGFDPGALEPAKGFSFSTWLFEALFAYPQRFLGLLRYLTPAIYFPIKDIYFVLRYDEAREVLDHDREFPVPWGAKMKYLTNDRNFVLGMQRGEEYKERYRELAKAFPLADVPDHVEAPALALAETIVKKVDGTEKREFDGVQDLIMTVPALLCQSYFGVEVANPVLFAKWTLAISAHVFGPEEEVEPPANPKAAAANLSAAIRKSIALAKGGKPLGPAVTALINRGLDDDAVHAHLFGMILGFIPTNVLAGGNMLETMLRRPDFLRQARAAAVDGDDDRLWRCLREALRFRNINPGPVRRCDDWYVLGRGSARPYTIPPDATVLACTQSGMFDERRIERPHQFDPDRRDEDYMVFGIGQHWCIGAYIAKAQITQTFKPLLRCENLRAVGGKARVTRFNGLFPLHLQVRFGP